MKVIIIGTGNTGRQLSAKLCEEKHDVTLIDQSKEPLVETEAQLDVLTIHGNGTSPAILQEANIDKADMVIAVTGQDEVNLLVSLFGHRAGVPHTIARVSNVEFLDRSGPLNPHSLGIKLVVSQQDECARKLKNIITMPGALEVLDMLDGRILVLAIRVAANSPLLEAPLQDLPSELLRTTRFIAALRDEELIVPHGDTQFDAGDIIYFSCQPADVQDTLDICIPDRSPFDKVVIAGGTDLGVCLAQKLEEKEIKTVVLEQSKEHAHLCSDILDQTLVLQSSALDKETFKEVGMTENTAFVAVTAHDENNIISCLLAKNTGAAFSIASVTRPEYVPVVDDLNLIDRAISPYGTMINAILRFIRGTNVRAAALLQHVPGELLELEISADNKWADMALKDIKMPKEAIVAGVLRNGGANVPTGDTVLLGGDRLLVFTPLKFANKLQSIF